MTRHFLELDEVPAGDLRTILDDAAAMKTARRGRPQLAPDDSLPLKDHIVALVFEKPSTRTRISFDVGIRQMGGETMILSGSEMQLGQGETVADTARVLSRYVDAIMIRTFADATLRELAEHATVPVINGLTNRSHPCQIMADILTYEEHRGPIKGARVVWAGDGNNVCASFVQAAKAFDFHLVFTGPETLDPDPEITAAVDGHFSIDRDPLSAARGADAIVTDKWLSMHDDQASAERRHNQLRPYQVTDGMMSAANPGALFLHCLPAKRDEEMTASVFDGPQSVVFDEAENRLHAQKGILKYCLAGA